MHHIHCIRKPLPPSSCATHTVDRCARLSDRSTICSVSWFGLPICRCRRNLSVGPSKRSLPIPHLSNTFHSPLLFFVYDSNEKRSRPENLILTYFFANLSIYVVPVGYSPCFVCRYSCSRMLAICADCLLFHLSLLRTYR